MKKYCITVSLVLGLIHSLSGQSLEEYFAMAAENNPGLHAKYLEFEAAMQQVSQVSSLSDPNLSFGYFISPVETRFGPQQARLSLVQMFPWFGTLKAQEDAAATQAQAKYQVFLDARNKLKYQLAVTYYRIYEVKRLMAIEEENLEVLNSYKDIAMTRFQNDKGSMVDVIRTDIMLSDALTNLELLGKEMEPLTTKFNKLLNSDENEPVSLPDTLVEMVIISDENRDSLLALNPRMQELALKVEANQYREVAAERQGLPKFGVGVDYVIIGKSPDIIADENGRDAIMPMISMSLPVFRGKYNSARNEARLMKEAYQMEQENLTNNLVSSFEMIQFEIERNIELILLYDRQLQESSRSLRLLYSAYGNTGSDFEEVLRMQQQVLKYRKLKVNATVACYQANAELIYLTDGSE